MQIEIKLIENKSDWEKFVLEQPYTLFVQSWKYGEFYKTMGERYWIYGVYEMDNLIGGSLVVTVSAKRGKYLYLPYGPIICDVKAEFTAEILNKLTSVLIKLAKQESCDFIKISPFWDDSPKRGEMMNELGYRLSPLHTTSENTWILGLDESVESILFNMNKGHRYLIRRCQKDGVKTSFSNDADSLELFNKLHDVTAIRHQFTRFSEKFIKLEFEAFNKYGEAAVINGYLPDGRLDSSAIIMFYGNMAAYRQGSSLNLDKRFPTSYLVQWHAIQEAKKRGMRWYNFWGVAPENTKKNHPFYGITHFKKGFGGFQRDLLHCRDLPVTSAYWLNWIVETVRKFRRGFA